ncbi:MAG TPA: enoyl-CoA hydratase/isomerase family protein, partial [Bryobacteraceae bacterium]|nr:enoyl-CoA hydratase/isomerase family protein [Bryobacteraceae bacterium]
KKMLDNKWLGDKTGQGFYKRVGKDFHAIDLKTLEYRPAQKVKFASAEAAKPIEDLAPRLRALVAANDRAGTFLWSVFSDLFLYSAEMVPEISDNVYNIDRAMRWGYANKFGPFELWDALGFRDVVNRLEKEGRKLPENIQEMVQQGASSFYCHDQGKTRYFDVVQSQYATLAERPGVLSLANVKSAHGVIEKNTGASLIDLGDGVLCCEFHSKMNALGDDIFKMLYVGLEKLKHFQAMVVANEGDNFSVGANLTMVLLGAQDGEWDEIDAAIGHFQKVNMAMKYAPKPVVSAPFARALGGGCEIALHTHPQACAELYMGLVEVGVGLIPGGGGCKELVARLKDARKVFELIGYAKVSGSADEAKQLGLLDKNAPVSMNADRLIGDAKAYALSLVPTYTPGVPRTDIKVSGQAGFALLKLGLWSARQGHYISDHDVTVGEKLAHVLCGGNLTGEQTVSEQYLLDLEREAFLSLCGNPKTQERMGYMLKTGKPLRN